MKKNFAFILAGCGGADGTEIHEATYSFLACRQFDCDYKCFSINKNQRIVKNSADGTIIKENRNLLVESARLAKNGIEDIKNLNVEDFDVLFFPGGPGSAINISTYFLDGKNYIVDNEVRNIILKFKQQNKPICAVCIAPMILNAVLKGIKLTIGNDKKIATIINDYGNIHIETKSGDICVDEKNKIITSPCFMLTKNQAIVYNEVYKIVENAINLSNLN